MCVGDSAALLRRQLRPLGQAEGHEKFGALLGLGAQRLRQEGKTYKEEAVERRGGTVERRTAASDRGHAGARRQLRPCKALVPPLPRPTGVAQAARERTWMTGCEQRCGVTSSPSCCCAASNAASSSARSPRAAAPTEGNCQPSATTGASFGAPSPSALAASAAAPGAPAAAAVEGRTSATRLLPGFSAITPYRVRGPLLPGSSATAMAALQGRGRGGMVGGRQWRQATRRRRRRKQRPRAPSRRLRCRRCALLQCPVATMESPAARKQFSMRRGRRAEGASGERRGLTT